MVCENEFGQFSRIEKLFKWKHSMANTLTTSLIVKSKTQTTRQVKDMGGNVHMKRGKGVPEVTALFFSNLCGHGT